jgi:hypothetical protein
VADSATTAGERRVLADAPSGELVDLSDLSDEERVISSDVIRRLCIGPEAKGVDPRGIRIEGAHIVESLDLSFCTVPHPLRFDGTTFDAIPHLSGTQLPALWIENCSLPGLWADEIRILGDLMLGLSRVSGAVRLTGARIGGLLGCAGATLTADDGVALYADRAEINGGVFLREVDATGAVWLHRVKASGPLDCSMATLVNEKGPALVADGAEINGGVFLSEGFNATGEVRLPGARINGQLDCSKATLTNKDGAAFFAEGAEINGGVFLREGFNATGEVRLGGVRINGWLDGSKATLINKKGPALVADGAQITGGVFLREGFSATGEVRLIGVKIGGQFDCPGATFTNEDGIALGADGAEVGGSVFLRAGFSATGQVRLHTARIGGQLSCSCATLANGAEIALLLRETTINNMLIFRDVHVTGGVDLFRVSATTLDDDLGEGDQPCGSWTAVQPLILDSFDYGRFAPRSKWDSKSRRRWLEQTSGFQQSAWLQLIEVYRAQGRDDEATRAAIAMHNDRVKRAGLPRYRRWGRQVLRVTIGHGYRPWLAGIWAVAIIAVFALVVWQWSGMFVAETESLTGSPQPVAYAADTFLPIVDLGEAGDWMPTGWVRWVDWTVILLGWALSTIFVAGFTRIVRS